MMKLKLSFALGALFAFAPVSRAAPETGTPAPAKAPAMDTRTPRVWIFNGLPGDDEHHALYEANLASLRSSLTERFHVPKDKITTLYGPVSAGYEGPCTRDALLAELAKISAHLKQPGAEPVWIFFQGHANAIPGGAMFNLPGPDASAREIGDALRPAPGSAPLVVFATTACGAAFIKPLAAPGRLLVSATKGGDQENETDFPFALAQALASEETDSNRDGTITVGELFLATKKRVHDLCEKNKFILTEHAILDGNGDGTGTERPAPEDARPAELIGLKTTPAATFE